MDLNSMLTILDKPKHDQVAWRRTLELQSLCGAKADVVAFTWNAMCEPSSTLSATDRKKLRHGLIEERKEWLSDLVTDADVKSRTIWTHDIADWVAAEVNKKKPDLVIKTVHKNKTLAHTPLDWDLFRECSAPVLMTTKRRGKGGGDVLASIDLRHNDAKHRHLNCKVLEAAHRFAELYRVKVQVVFAVEVSQVLRDLDIVSESVSKRKIVEKVTPELNRLLKPYNIPKSRIHLPVGKPGQVVAQVARKQKANLLVVGTYAHRAKRILGVGNTAEKILNRAACDVLAVHP